MKKYKLTNRVIVPITKTEAWEFLSNPANLEKITSEDLKFRSLDPLPTEMYEGMIIRYQIRPFLNIRLNWITKITDIDEGTMFIDEQYSGPFRYWKHEHRLIETSAGTEIHDIVYYEIPFFFLGRIAHKLFIRKKIQTFFDYRNEKITNYFA